MAQSAQDTLKASVVVKKTDHRPRTASLLSAALPGLGQIYNKRIWKVPIIYVLGTALGAWVYDNAVLRKKFSEQYKYMVREKLTISPSTPFTPGAPDFAVTDIYNRTYDLTNVSLDNIKFYRDNAERQRDLNVIGLAGLYVLNIIDANVDAHLRDFYISDDLTLHWQPEYKILPSGGSYIGICLSLHFLESKNKPYFH